MFVFSDRRRIEEFFESILLEFHFPARYEDARPPDSTRHLPAVFLPRTDPNLDRRIFPDPTLEEPEVEHPFVSRYLHRDRIAVPPRRNRHLTDDDQYRWFVDFVVGCCFVEDNVVEEEAEAESATESQTVIVIGPLLVRLLVLCGLLLTSQWRQLRFPLRVKLF